ncbi:MCE family protein [Rhodococcus sp. 15-2388-1-1a]|uniref:MlaD family protein n=1 Tax=Nocardiaceae TaxID=85025 RepID=UPI00056A2A2A|nr:MULTISPECIES: MCE family protein [Rhodococcus]OZF05138.1 MCE family protein [Rhodococcus sp. 15-2388-1-1a]
MRRPVTVQLILFAITSVVALVAGTVYALGPSALQGSITVTATTTDAANLGVGAGVTYRGIEIGRVTDVALSADGLGADIAVSLDPDASVPVGSPARVTDSNALGIQTLDIVPTTAEGPYLVDGDTLTVDDADRPRRLDEVITSISTLVDSIDPATVSSLTQTMGTALDGTGPALGRVIDDVDTLTRMLDAQAPALADILDTGLPMLDALAPASNSLPATAAVTRDVTGQLVGNEPSLVYLLDRSPAMLTRTQHLLDDTRGTAGALLTNLVSVTGVLGDRTPALSALLTALPDTLGKLTSVVHGDRGDFTLVATQGPVCWYDTPRRAVGDESPRDPNLTLYCPPGENLAQRGSQNAPRPNDLGLTDSTRPGNVTGPPIADDPVLIPTGLEALDYWKKLLEGVQQ